MKWNWLPSLCTLANLGAGVLSLYFTIHEQYMTAFTLVVVAALWDVLDGLLARLLHCSSDFGKQLDSLADVVSFGVAPAFLILLYRLGDTHWIGPLVAVLFVICGAVRLARFNLMAFSKGFVGMPITAAGVILSFVFLWSEHLKPELLLALMVVLSFLMVSRIPFPSFKK
ncbi:CDP-diacylglycerol--serine O-phosphatidyltransferase [Paenibacillus sp. CMAA1739]|uniref:CDP-diacylglycerol--serine O-phosphatidyltransferase n=1 Tax=Paenibacillus ottowii TaxID=2315729 RepID=UPI00272FD267|nr:MULTISPECIES: CDP-diacylglycerol--serine O-phosphatidyltransferase [Paenibacillus]MDP1512310.1 CDP-diacylglycerol--serine O-phosphatidyltransferase [Paenibacillus ottowii]MEC4568280.1 CDP-diacylglycerol--serine O-phosphatidyltransferase [Paenibacillus sp. CMAA1739]